LIISVRVSYMCFALRVLYISDNALFLDRHLPNGGR